MLQPVIQTFVLGDYQTNCFVVHVPPDKACWIVDCGMEPDEMLEWIDRSGLKPAAILLTHTHLDHIAGVNQALEKFGSNLPLYVHNAEAGYCSDPRRNLSAFIGMPTICREPDHYLKGGEVLTLGGTTWRVLHTPGHSPGGVCYIQDESKQAIVGDTLFAGSIGRFDFPTSNHADLRHTILNVMMSLPEDMIIHPGHGESTTIGQERSSNPYIRNGF